MRIVIESKVSRQTSVSRVIQQILTKQNVLLCLRFQGIAGVDAVGISVEDVEIKVVALPLISGVAATVYLVFWRGFL